LLRRIMTFIPSGVSSMSEISSATSSVAKRASEAKQQQGTITDALQAGAGVGGHGEQVLGGGG
jgi:hypothetical protein